MQLAEGEFQRLTLAGFQRDAKAIVGEISSTGLGFFGCGLVVRLLHDYYEIRKYRFVARRSAHNLVGQPHARGAGKRRGAGSKRLPAAVVSEACCAPMPIRRGRTPKRSIRRSASKLRWFDAYYATVPGAPKAVSREWSWSSTAPGNVICRRDGLAARAT